jgi:spore coat protein CotH
VCLRRPFRGCSQGTSASSAPSPSTPTSTPGTSVPGSNPTTSGTATVSSPSYEDFWSYGKDAKLSLAFSNAALAALSDYGVNYSLKYSDVYFPATFTCVLAGVTYTYPEVGVRMKGATSRVEIASSNGTITDVCHFKVSFKETFDGTLYSLTQFSSFRKDWTGKDTERKARKDRTFARMEKLDLKYLPRNQNEQTYSQDIYCYKIFNDFGVAAPQARWTSLTFKDEAASKTSAYEAVESIDDVFLERHFGESSGDLYKCTQVILSSGGASRGASYTKADLSLSGAVTSSTGSNGYANGTRVAKGYIGVEDNYNLYHPNYSLKTNDKNGENSDFSKMANLINVAYSLRYLSAPYSLLDATLDVDQFLNFSALSYLLGNFDDQRNNYNNYYVYFRSSDSKAVYIPYDWDYSLGAYKTTDITSFGMFYQGSTHETKNTNNLYWDTILTNTSLAYYSQEKTMQTTYKNDILNAVKQGALTYSNYVSFLGSLANRLSSSTEESSVSSYMSRKTTVING